METRIFNQPEVRVKIKKETDDSEQSRRIIGRGVVFNADSSPMWFLDMKRGMIQVIEQMRPEAFAKTRFANVISAFNHDMNLILGRGASGTLNLTMNEQGIDYEIDVPETTYGNDLLVSVRRKDVVGASFMFTIDEAQGWEIEEREADKVLVVRPVAVREVFEIGPVSMPAYPETTAQSRSSALGNAIQEYFRQKDEKQNKPNPPVDNTADLAKIDDLLAKL